MVGVIGPFNYPLHLCHAHVVPALLMGNTVVVKPSEVTPLAGQRYAEAVHAAGLPAGVLNLINGGAEAGVALIGHPAVRGLCFTGSYPVGRQIQEQTQDRPEVLVALEMGGKNTAIVLDDASVRQAAHEIVVGGYLTTGQRCTATDRVLVHRSLAGALIEALRPLVASLRFGDPEDPVSFAGPLATAGGRERFEAALARARAAGAEPLVLGGRPDEGVGGYFVRPSLHRLPDGVHQVAGYTDVEVFGPDVGIEVFDDDDEAIAVVNASPYGFANAVFTASTERFDRIYRCTNAGIVNRNRSTNLASPRLPFGGVGRSGNYRPAGAHSLRNVAVPTAVQDNVLGTMQVHPMLAAHLPPPDLDRLDAQHAAEERREAGRRLFDEPRPMGLRRPAGGRMPESESWLVRLYAGERVVREKKPAVFDHLRSFGPWFVSIDREPLSVLDGMSQTATICGGFSEDSVVRAYIEGEFGDTLVASADTSAVEHESAQALATTLRDLVPGLPHVTLQTAAPRPTRRRWPCAGSTPGARLRARSWPSRAASTAGRCWRCTRPTIRPSGRHSRLPGTRPRSRRSRCGARPTRSSPLHLRASTRRPPPVTSTSCSAGSGARKTIVCWPRRCARWWQCTARWPAGSTSRASSSRCSARAAIATPPSGSSGRCGCSRGITRCLWCSTRSRPASDWAGRLRGTVASAGELPRPGRYAGRGDVRQAGAGRGDHESRSRIPSPRPRSPRRWCAAGCTPR